MKKTVKWKDRHGHRRQWTIEMPAEGQMKLARNQDGTARIYMHYGKIDGRTAYVFMPCCTLNQSNTEGDHVSA